MIYLLSKSFGYIIITAKEKGEKREIDSFFRYIMEIERKFTLKSIPENLEDYPCRHIEQAYLNADPVVRVRREDNEYYMTYKGSGMLAREESNLPLNEKAYYHLLAKSDGNIISKRRYLIPLKNPGFKAGWPTPPDDYSLTIELDIFDPPFAPLVMAEVEFGSREAAEAFLPPDWFDEDVTYHKEYHNSYMALNADVQKKSVSDVSAEHE